MFQAGAGSLSEYVMLGAELGQHEGQEVEEIVLMEGAASELVAAWREEARSVEGEDAKTVEGPTQPFVVEYLEVPKMTLVAAEVVPGSAEEQMDQWPLKCAG